MGQYFYVVNLDKKQYLHPHKFGEGLKFLEFAGGGATMLGLAMLVSDGNGRGGGDLRSDDPLVGSWAGDRIVIAGDYADGGKYGIDDVAGEPLNAHNFADLHCEDISHRVIKAMRRDSEFAEYPEKS